MYTKRRNTPVMPTNRSLSFLFQQTVRIGREFSRAISAAIMDPKPGKLLRDSKCLIMLLYLYFLSDNNNKTLFVSQFTENWNEYKERSLAYANVGML
jgi:hypothetical protein